jgi:hypothetical protein
MPDLKIRFITESDAVSAAIRFVTFSEFSHTEIELPDGSFLGAHAGSGVQIRPANYCKPTFERGYALPVDDEKYAQAMKYAHSCIGYSYNYTDIVGLLFHHNLTSKGRVICSQFVFDVMTVAGIQSLNVLQAYDFRVTPDILHLSPVFIGKQYLQTAVPK